MFLPLSNVQAARLAVSRLMGLEAPRKRELASIVKSSGDRGCFDASRRATASRELSASARTGTRGHAGSLPPARPSAIFGACLGGAAFADARRRVEAPKQSSQHGASLLLRTSPQSQADALLPDAEQIVEHLHGKTPEVVKSIPKILQAFLLAPCFSGQRDGTWRLRPKIPEQVNGGCPGLWLAQLYMQCILDP